MKKLFFTKEKKDVSSNENSRNEVALWIKSCVAGVLVGLIAINIMPTTTIVGESMCPTINSKDYLIVNKLAYIKSEPSRGDVIVFNTNLENENGEKKNLVKRIVGLPNEHLVIKDGSVYVNGDLIDEPYLNSNYTDGNVDILIQENQYFVMGDNREVSRDSRDTFIGTIKEDDIEGKASLKYSSINDIELVR